MRAEDSEDNRVQGAEGSRGQVKMLFKIKLKINNLNP